MLFFGFIFSSVAGYMAGLVGSSNNPISGVTIATVIISALILLQLMGNEGIAATLGPIAVIYLAGLICSAAAIAGDNMQDLKCGHIVGATPWRQQLFQVIGVLAAALVIPFVLRVLDAGYGIGRVVQEGVTPLGGAPGGTHGQPGRRHLRRRHRLELHLHGLWTGGVADHPRRDPEEARLELSLPRAGGGRGRLPTAQSVGPHLHRRPDLLLRESEASAGASEEVKQKRENAGLLVASGLITGEALMGVAISIAAVVLANMGSGLPAPMAFAGWLGTAVLIRSDRLPVPADDERGVGGGRRHSTPEAAGLRVPAVRAVSRRLMAGTEAGRFSRSPRTQQLRRGGACLRPKTSVTLLFIEDQVPGASGWRRARPLPGCSPTGEESGQLDLCDCYYLAPWVAASHFLVSGASGHGRCRAPCWRRLARQDEVERVHLVVSRGASQVLHHGLGPERTGAADLIEAAGPLAFGDREKVETHRNNELDADHLVGLLQARRGGDRPL